MTLGSMAKREIALWSHHILTAVCGEFCAFFSLCLMEIGNIILYIVQGILGHKIF